MWGSPCCCPVPCAAICYRRCFPSGTPCCSYSCATPPPSSIPVQIGCSKKKGKKKKKGKRLSGVFTPSQMALLTPSKIAMLSPSKLALLTPSKLALLSPSTQDMFNKMKNKEAGGGGYAGSEGGFVTRRCDPRCKARRTRPATSDCTPRTTTNDFCPAKYQNNASVYCGIGGVHRLDAATTTDIKTNTSTSTNNLDFFCCAQKAAEKTMQSGICKNPQCSMQQQYNQALQQQYLQKCYYCQLMAQQNPFWYNNLSTAQLPQTPLYQNAMMSSQLRQNTPQSQNSFYQQRLPPCPSIFSGSFPFSSNPSQFTPFQTMSLSWPSATTPVTTAGCSNDPGPCKKCETCGRMNPKK